MSTDKTPASVADVPPGELEKPIPVQLVRAQVEVIGAVILAVLMLNFYRHRFFCNYLCPLGALYGLLSRFSGLSFTAGKKCTDCDHCLSHCSFGGGPRSDLTGSECLACFNCTESCPATAITVKPVLLKQIPQTEVDPGKRGLIGAAATGAFLAALPRLAPAAKGGRHGFVRPPGSARESEFLQKCIRCGACVQACPTSFLQAAGLVTGVEGIWTPVANASTGFCKYDCTACLDVCPTGAIIPTPLYEKRFFRIGTAVIDRNRCFTHADGFNCTICADRCPIPERAIKYRQVQMWNFKGKQVTVNQIYVDADLCNGCGICEYVCPRKDAPGITLTADGELRQL